MTEKNVQPAAQAAAGSDEDVDEQKLWNEFEKADQGGTAPASETSDNARLPGDGPTTTETTAEPASVDETSAAEHETKDSADGTGTAEAAPQPVDIWANAPPDLRAAHEATRKELDTTQTKYRRVSGTVASYQRTADALRREVDTLKAGKPAGASAAAKDSVEPPKGFDDQAWKKFQDDYPEVAGPMIALREETARVSAENAALKSELGGISAVHRERYLDEQYRRVIETHPDYDRIAKSDTFQAWYEQAPPYLRVGVERNGVVVVDGDEVAHIVSVFKSETGAGGAAKPPPPRGGGSPQPPVSDKRTLQLEAASTPRGKGPAKVHSGLPEPDDGEGMWNYLERQDAEAARRQGLNR